MHVAVQFIQYGVVSFAEPYVLRQGQHRYPGIAEIGGGQLAAAAVGAAVIHHIQVQNRAGV